MIASVIRETIRFPGLHGPLHGELAYPAIDKPAFAALVVGPHPYMGGTMHNALIAAVAEEVALAGGVTLRFDYSGAGESAGPTIDVALSMGAFWETGHAPEDPDRLHDSRSAQSFLAQLGVSPVTVVGYSFGAAAAWQLYMNAPHAISSLALISPTLARHAFALPTVPMDDARVLVVHSRDDFCTPHQRVEEWVQSLPFRANFRCLTGGNHFFRGGEHEIAQMVSRFLAPATEGVMC
jgi:alpha/beta superfamily hydrolase